MPEERSETEELLQRAGLGDSQALGVLFSRHAERLRRMVRMRMDRRLQGRLDASDVLQDAYLQFSRSLQDYLRNPNMPFFLWLRLITGRKLHALHRHHLGTKIRAVGLEVSLHGGAFPQVSSVSLAAQLLGHYTSPSDVAMRAELQAQVQEALNGMSLLDREVLSLRHFEQLSNSEAAYVLGISEAAASNRFVRALKRMKALLTAEPGGVDNVPGSNDSAPS